jgi:hypothetical protein
MLPMLWAQAPPPDPLAVPALAFRRWYSSLTLSSPDPVPSRNALLAWLLGLAALLLLAVVAQGPVRALGQLLDLPGLVRLVSAAMGRLRRAGRLVAVLLGTTVLAWTVSQALSYSKEDRREDLVALLRTKSLREVSLEQGVLAAVTPLRDVFGLADNLLLLVAAAVLVFKLSADRWGGGGGGDDYLLHPRPAVSGGSTLCWGSAWLYAMYRFASLVVEGEGLPLGGCLFVEAAIVPLLMALADGLLLAWVLVELRAATPEADGGQGFDVAGTVALTPMAALACVAALPARYVAVGSYLILNDVSSLKTSTPLPIFVAGWGLVALQGAALVTVGVAGVVAWGWRGPGGMLRGYGRLLRAEGGRLVAALAVGGVACGGLSALAYALVLALPPQPWVLSAADSYAHYATLPVGLLLLAALVELGSRVPPPAIEEPAEAAPVEDAALV